MLGALLGSWQAPAQDCCYRPGHGGASGVAGKCVADEDCPEEITPGEVSRPAVEALVETERESASFSRTLPVGPRERMVPTYATAEVQGFQGEPVFTGKILQLNLGQSVREVQLTLYAGGFSLVPYDCEAHGQQQGVSRAWSPFSLVEKCQVRTARHVAFWAVFKLFVCRKDRQNQCFYFATTGRDAYELRDRWVLEMVTAISNVTVSLFPRHAIKVSPLPGIAATSTRIMAGYLLQLGASDSVSRIYCELHAYSHREARLALYHDEWCDLELGNIHLVESSTVSTNSSSSCTAFTIDTHHLCARTCEEKELWVRAVSNVKVKLMFEAPDPTDQELCIFRTAVDERIAALQDRLDLRGTTVNPLLELVPRLPLANPQGDAWDPEPIDDASDTPSAESAGGGCQFAEVMQPNLLAPESRKPTGEDQAPPASPTGACHSMQPGKLETVPAAAGRSEVARHMQGPHPVGCQSPSGDSNSPTVDSVSPGIVVALPWTAVPDTPGDASPSDTDAASPVGASP